MAKKPIDPSEPIERPDASGGGKKPKLTDPSEPIEKPDPSG